jgi:hypothetical protein
MARWICSDDPIPEGHIRLSQAFDLYYEAVTPNWHELDAAVDAANPPEGQSSAAHFRGLDIARRAAFDARDAARDEADKKFRAALAAGELRAMIRDPDKGELLELSQSGWDKAANGFPGGFDEDFVEPGDAFQPGPAAVIDGYLRPVFFSLEDFKNWLHSAAGDDGIRRKSVGRPRIYNRERIRKLVFEKMDYHDEFCPDDPEWKSQADLERANADEFAQSKRTPSESTIRDLIHEPLEAWRAKKAGN